MISSDNCVKRTGISLDRMISSSNEVKKLRKESRSALPKHPDLGKPINWLFVQKGRETDKPLISFRMKPETREAVLKLFRMDRRKMNPRQKETKTSITNRFRDEFIAVYCRYRQEVLKEKGKIGEYYVQPRDVKTAEVVALNCFSAEIPPVVVLNYWHKKLKSFANRNLEFIPLNMLMSSSVVEEAAINNISSKKIAVEFDESDDEDWRAPKRKTMWLGDSSTLHPRLRRDLMGAGFDLSKHNDSDLSTIQDYAMDVKSGDIGIKLIPENLRAMIKWALENTLKNAETKNFSYRT